LHRPDTAAPSIKPANGQQDCAASDLLLTPAETTELVAA
jgi:hypothetical protein